MNAYGLDVTEQMPVELINWIKDTTILRSVLGGSGTPILEAMEKDQSLLAKEETEMN